MRNTKQKELVEKIVSESFDHLTAQEIYEEAKKSIPNISLGTVYRILNNLVDTHKIIEIHPEGAKEHFDHLTKTKHNHFICEKCGRIVDIYDLKLEYDSHELDDYDVTDMELTLKGICNDCKRKEDL